MAGDDARELLGASAESFELLLGSMPDIVLLVDRDGRVLYANRDAPTTGTTLFEHGLGPEAEVRMRRAIERVFGSGEHVSYEVESRDVAGEQAAWYLSRWGPVERDGQVVAALVIASDITRRVQLEHDLERMSHVGSWEWRPATGQLTWSDELFAIFGVDRESFTPSFDGFLGLIHPDDRDFVKSMAERALATGEGFSIDERIVRPSGEERVLVSSARLEAVEDGEPRLVGVCVDITERKRAELELEHVSRQQEVILASAGEGVLGLDERGHVSFANPAAAELLGWPPGQLEGKNIHDLVHERRTDAPSHDV